MQKAYSRFCGCQMREFIKGRRWGDVVSALCADDGLPQGIESQARRYNDLAATMARV
jgi:hypothetical protein